MRVPLRHHLAAGDRITLAYRQFGAIGDPVPLALAAMLVGDRQFAGARDRDIVSIPVPHDVQVMKPDHAVSLDGDVVHRGGP